MLSQRSCHKRQQGEGAGTPTKGIHRKEGAVVYKRNDADAGRGMKPRTAAGEWEAKRRNAEEATSVRPPTAPSGCPVGGGRESAVVGGANF